MKPKKPYVGTIPFNDAGDQLNYPAHTWCAGPDGKWDGKPCNMVDNFVFEDTLTYSHYEKGRSAFNLVFCRSNGAEVRFFASDADGLIPRLVNGRVTGKWTFSKRGANYGCVPVLDEA